MTSPIVRTFGLALALVVFWTAAGCSSVPDAEWAQRPTLPPAPSDDARRPLLDCGSPEDEGTLCPGLAATDADRRERRAICVTMTEEPTLAFFGHRCVAAHSIWSAHNVTTRTRISDEALGDDATTDRRVAAAEAQIRAARAGHLSDARLHLEAALDIEPNARHVLRHLVGVDAERMLADDADTVAADTLDSTRALARHPDVEIDDLDDALGVAERLDADGWERVARDMVAALVAGRDNFAAGHTTLGRWALRARALGVAADRLDDARALPGAPLETWPLRIQVALLQRDLDAAAAVAAETEQAALEPLQTHPAVLAVLATSGSSEASSRAAHAGLAPIVEPLQRVERAVRSKAGPAAAGDLALELVTDDDTVLIGLALALAVTAANPTSIDGASALAGGLLLHGLRADSGTVMVEMVRARDAAGTDAAALEAARLAAADHLASLGDPGRAQQQLDQIAERGADWHFVQGYVHATLGQNDDARESWRETMRLAPGSELATAAKDAIEALRKR